MLATFRCFALSRRDYDSRNDLLNYDEFLKYFTPPFKLYWESLKKRF